ncbi:hypothetical protein SAMN02745857_02464 [Andreprevotia lacus DSM 23236]|jgi:uncharacterized protein YbaP (TraB family)|uniref:TraB family protein n=1 Tax=Andreprevotia lacus DSM 23236 TaxID=1121001 RepID=A0A1W1XS70_9NEIS|nr:TraB/GumN family protein [Andreprevotia lacus]SMC26368.1 hypothetical protein SAMN02745857_02464 [Andreprevotia lacus DSM 23236]
MFKRFRSLMLSLCAASLLAPLPALAAKPVTKVSAEATPAAVLWRIDKPGVKSSWLFGTAHVSDPKVTTLSKPIQTAFDNADHVATEVRLDFNMMMTLAKAMLMPEDQKLVDIIGADRYNKLLPELEARSYPEVAARRMKPWAVAMQLMVPLHKSGEPPLDLLLAKMSIEGEKDYVGLETVEEQISVFEDMPRDKQLVLLDSLINQQSKLEGYYKQLIGLYVKRDLDGMVKFADKDEVDLPADAKAYFDEWKNKTMLSDRNVRMTERMQPLLEKGNSFIAVGALHLPGKDGLIASLRAQGYTLTPIFDKKK